MNSTIIYLNLLLSINLFHRLISCSGNSEQITYVYKWIYVPSGLPRLMGYWGSRHRDSTVHTIIYNYKYPLPPEKTVFGYEHSTS